MATLQIHCERNLRDKWSARGGREAGEFEFGRLGLTTFVLAITTDLHHVRLLGLFAILAAILAVFLRRAIAGGMRAFSRCILGHKLPYFLVGPYLSLILRLEAAVVKAPGLIF